MASATTEKDDEKAMASDLAASGGDADDAKESKHHAPPPEASGAGSAGFFHIYKSGQGYWTRMGTALGALLLAGLTAYFFYHHMPVWLTSSGMPSPKAKTITVAVIGGGFVAFGLLVFWLMNKPSNADFLIATDSEMKKVNWTSRKELIGSTKVVIIFMFLIAFLLFAFDILFGYLFYFMNVLNSKPF
jgi:preprotein translocase subunit SecE